MNHCFWLQRRSILLCAYTLLKAKWLPAPSHPTTPLPAGAALLPSIPEADHRGEESNFSPTTSIFQKGSLWSYSSPKTQLHHHGKEKSQRDLAPSPSWPLGRDPQHSLSWFSKLSQFCDNIKPIPLPSYQSKLAFPAPVSLSSFLIPTESPDIQRKGKRNRGRERELNIK